MQAVGSAVMRAAAADHSTIVQSGAIAATPRSRLSSSALVSIWAAFPAETTPRGPDRGRNGAGGRGPEYGDNAIRAFRGRSAHNVVVSAARRQCDGDHQLRPHVPASHGGSISGPE